LATSPQDSESGMNADAAKILALEEAISYLSHDLDELREHVQALSEGLGKAERRIRVLESRNQDGSSVGALPEQVPTEPSHPLAMTDQTDSDTPRR